MYQIEDICTNKLKKVEFIQFRFFGLWPTESRFTDSNKSKPSDCVIYDKKNAPLQKILFNKVLSEQFKMN